MNKTMSNILPDFQKYLMENKLVPNWKEFLKGGIQEKKYQKLRQHERTGRPLGSESFIDRLEVLLGIQLRKKKTGPKGPLKNRGP